MPLIARTRGTPSPRRPAPAAASVVRIVLVRHLDREHGAGRRRLEDGGDARRRAGRHQEPVMCSPETRAIRRWIRNRRSLPGTSRDLRVPWRRRSPAWRRRPREAQQRLWRRPISAVKGGEYSSAVPGDTPPPRVRKATAARTRPTPGTPATSHKGRRPSRASRSSTTTRSNSATPSPVTTPTTADTTTTWVDRRASRSQLGLAAVHQPTHPPPCSAHPLPQPIAHACSATSPAVHGTPGAHRPSNCAVQATCPRRSQRSPCRRARGHGADPPRPGCTHRLTTTSRRCSVDGQRSISPRRTRRSHMRVIVEE